MQKQSNKDAESNDPVNYHPPETKLSELKKKLIQKVKKKLHDKAWEYRPTDFDTKSYITAATTARQNTSYEEPIESYSKVLKKPVVNNNATFKTI